MEVAIKTLPDAYVTRGTFELKVNISLLTLRAEKLFLGNAKERFWNTCQELEANLQTLHCNQANLNLQDRLEDINFKTEFIEDFFTSKRNKRSVWSALGAMDSSDRDRIDNNMDKLRSNEENLKHNLQHQNDILDATYGFVNKSVLDMDNNLVSMHGEFESIKQEIAYIADFSNKVRRIALLEAKLLEMSFWIDNLCRRLGKKLDTIVTILMNRVTNDGILNKLFPPKILLNILKNLEDSYDDGMSFPRDNNGNIAIEVLDAIRYKHELEKDKMLLSFEIPLVNGIRYSVRKVNFVPTMNNNTVFITHTDENVLLYRDIDEWGYTMSSEELEQCTHLKDVMLCKGEKVQENLLQTRKCVISVVLFNATTHCQTKAIQTNHTMWFASGVTNVWKYFAPSITNLTESINGNISYRSIYGAGEITISPNTTIFSKYIKLEYFAEDKNSINLALVSANDTWDWEMKTNDIPVWHGNEKVYSYTDRKKLFDLGVDIQTLKQDIPFLKNLVYAPLEKPWVSFPILAGIGMLVLILICCKGKLVCCTRKTVIDPFAKSVNQMEMQHKHVVRRAEKKKSKKSDIIGLPDSTYEEPIHWVNEKPPTKGTTLNTKISTNHEKPEAKAMKKIVENKAKEESLAVQNEKIEKQSNRRNLQINALYVY